MSVPRLAHRPSVHMHYAPSESAQGQYPRLLPRGSQALSTPCQRCLLPVLLGLPCSGRPSLHLLTCELPRFVLSSESLSATPTCAHSNSTDIDGHGRAVTRPRIEELCDAQMERLNDGPEELKSGRQDGPEELSRKSLE
jgi:hypothetical protein